MQVFKELTGTPALFADVRHYHADLGVWDLCNSGEHATYFAGRSDDPAVNLPRVEFRPQGFYFPAGGAAVYHIAAPGAVTLARLTRHDRRYRMAIVTRRVRRLRRPQPRDRRALARTTGRMPSRGSDCPVERFIDQFHCNHIHGAYGDWTRELELVGRNLNIETVRL